MKRPIFMHIALSAFLALFLTTIFNAEAQAQSKRLYHFKAPTSYETFRMYRVHIYTGEMAMCWLNTPDGRPPFTECRKAGPGAGPQKRGLYRLETTSALDTGIYRVNELTGEMSICWVGKNTGTVRCTEQAR